ncbi:hypothetical protein AZI87_12000 [Bdellovibrio bacteriovorus]|uniref:N-acetyltransferase domain-containing protein n=1 Tax=Bdellovibrio bacteriovorus TaxID=959 RepID=A0A162G8D0_BDEBC|nr:GNAT family N-acetyltransferase [Bdellovibrio bacteriovorus]KYG65271.1 hypothetical protein AZI87_12000 [Bdellovibrio bacteriovorus]
MKLYHSYINERLNQELFLIPEVGFAVYRIIKNDCFLVDIFVAKEYRRTGYGLVIADEVVKIAKAQGCTKLYGTVLTTANGFENSKGALEFYGMKQIGADGDLLIYWKDI